MSSEPKVYFIGAGPGAVEHLTLKGAEALSRCLTVFAPAPYEETFAGHLQGKTVLVPFDFSFADLLARIRRSLELGSVAFLVPGDQTFYSPFQGVIDALAEQAEVIPGVGTANAASALLKKTLDLPRVCNRAIITSPRQLQETAGAPGLSELAAPGVTLLLYMVHRPLSEVVAELRAGYGRDVPIAILHRLGLPGETVVTGTLDDIVTKVGDRDFFGLTGDRQGPSLSLVLVGESLTATNDGAWWDHKREKVWGKE